MEIEIVTSHPYTPHPHGEVSFQPSMLCSLYHQEFSQSPVWGVFTYRVTSDLMLGHLELEVWWGVYTFSVASCKVIGWRFEWSPSVLRMTLSSFGLTAAPCLQLSLLSSSMERVSWLLFSSCLGTIAMVSIRQENLCWKMIIKEIVLYLQQPRLT